MQGLTDRNDPVAEAALKGNGVQSVEETLERIVRRDAVGQGEEASQPRLPTLGPGNDFRPGIGTAQDGADGDYDDVHQQVQTPMGTARVFQLAEVSLEGKGQRDRAGGRVGRGGRRHDSPLWRARAEENGRGWSLTKSTSNEECGRSMRRRPCPEGVYDDPKAGALREGIYHRLDHHTQFTNEAGLFPEVMNKTKYS